MSIRGDIANRIGYAMHFCVVIGAMERMRDKEEVEVGNERE